MKLLNKQSTRSQPFLQFVQDCKAIPDLKALKLNYENDRGTANLEELVCAA